MLDLDQDPKLVIAMENQDRFPVDINTADLPTLLRTPGIGPISADRIMRQRRNATIDNWRDLKTMGVVWKKAKGFVVMPGHRPEPARQMRMQLLGHTEPRSSVDLADVKREAVAASSGRSGTDSPTGAYSDCSGRSSCSGCPLFGAPGHPGSGTGSVMDRSKELVAV